MPSELEKWKAEIRKSADNVAKPDAPNSGDGGRPSMARMRSISFPKLPRFATKSKPESLRSLLDNVGKLLEAYPNIGAREPFNGGQMYLALQTVVGIDKAEIIAAYAKEQENHIFKDPTEEIIAFMKEGSNPIAHRISQSANKIIDTYDKHRKQDSTSGRGLDNKVTSDKTNTFHDLSSMWKRVEKFASVAARGNSNEVKEYLTMTTPPLKEYLIDALNGIIEYANADSKTFPRHDADKLNPGIKLEELEALQAQLSDSPDVHNTTSHRLA